MSSHSREETAWSPNKLRRPRQAHRRGAQLHALSSKLMWPGGSWGPLIPP